MAGTAKLFSRVSTWFFLGILYSVNIVQYPLFTENQNTKFLHAAAATGYGLLADDWMANTLDPLPLFSTFVGLLFSIDGIWLSYLLFAGLLGICLYALFGIADRLFGIGKSWVSSFFFLAFLFLEQKNMQLGFGSQYLLGHYLQPCVFGVFLLLSIYRHLEEKPLRASFWLAVAGAFHPAYMPAALLIQGAYTFSALKRRVPDSKPWFAPLLLFLVLSAPLVIRYKLLFAQADPQTSAEAMRILSTQRIAVHTKVRNWFNHEDVIGLALITAAMIPVRKTPLLWIMCALLSIVALSVPALYLYPYPPLEVLTPWRTSVILLPLAYAVLAGWLAGRMAAAFEEKRLAHVSVTLLSAAVIAASVSLHIPKQLSALERYLIAPEKGLEQFVKNHRTRGDNYLIPNRETAFECFRLHTGVPVFVNWKTHPYKDTEIMEWHHRNMLAETFYRHIDDPSGMKALQEIRLRYGVTHVVVPTEKADNSFPGMRSIYSDPHYTVFAVTANPSEEHALTIPFRVLHSAEPPFCFLNSVPISGASCGWA